MTYKQCKMAKSGWNTNAQTKPNLNIDILGSISSIVLWTILAIVSVWGLICCGIAQITSIIFTLCVVAWGICIVKCHAYMSKIELGGIGLLMGIFLPPIVNVIIAAIVWKIVVSIESISFNR